jgi:1-acyl-sn-glycerol-3-phosphate acyltransferase
MNPERILAWLARIARLLTAPFVRYDIRGGRCARELDCGVIAMNHRSMFDIVVGLIALHHFGHYPRLLVDRTYVEARWTAPFARALGAIPVDRINGGGTSVEEALGALRDGTSIVVMPEGRLHRDADDPTTTGPTRTGVSRLAVDSGVPVVPVGTTGTTAVLPYGARVPRFNPFRRKTVIRHVADDAIWLTGDDHRANTDEVMAAIRALLVLPSQREERPDR